MASSLEALQECSICTVKYGEPQILPCQHTFCKSCIIQLCKQRSPTCPNCRAQFQRNSVKVDFRLKQILYLIKEEDRDSGKESSTIAMRSHCKFCEENAITHICTNCNQGVCRRCGELHLKAKSSRKHTVKTMKDIWKTLKPNYKDFLDKINSRIEKFVEIECEVEMRKAKLHRIHDKTLTELKCMRENFKKIINDKFDKEEKKLQSLISTALRECDEFTAEKVQMTEERLRLESNMANEIPSLVLNYRNFCEFYKVGLPITHTLPNQKRVCIETCNKAIDQNKLVNVSLVENNCQPSGQTSTVQKVIRCTFKIFMRMPDKLLASIDVTPSLTVHKLKASLNNKLRLSSTQTLQLIHRDKVMKDSCTVVDYNIQNHDTVCCTILDCQQIDRDRFEEVYKTLQNSGFYKSPKKKKKTKDAIPGKMSGKSS